MRIASIAVSSAQVIRSRPKTKPPMTGKPELFRIGPRRQVPSVGPVKLNDSGSVCPVEVLLTVLTLHAPDGALGVRRGLPLFVCVCEACDAKDKLDALRPKSSVPAIEEDDDECPELLLLETMLPKARPMRSTARLPKPMANPAAGARPLVILMAVCRREPGWLGDEGSC